jgi:hypothetical protein
MAPSLASAAIASKIADIMRHSTEWSTDPAAAASAAVELEQLKDLLSMEQSANGGAWTAVDTGQLSSMLSSASSAFYSITSAHPPVGTGAGGAVTGQGIGGSPGATPTATGTGVMVFEGGGLRRSGWERGYVIVLVSTVVVLMM